MSASQGDCPLSAIHPLGSLGLFGTQEPRRDALKSDGDVVEILETFDLTGRLRDAAELAGCSPNTVARAVRLWARDRPLEEPIRRNQPRGSTPRQGRGAGS